MTTLQRVIEDLGYTPHSYSKSDKSPCLAVLVDDLFKFGIELGYILGREPATNTFDWGYRFTLSGERQTLVYFPDVEYQEK